MHDPYVPDRDWAERVRSGCESGADLPLIAEADSRGVGLALSRFPDPTAFEPVGERRPVREGSPLMRQPMLLRPRAG
jgi:hypothetical protein